MSVEQSIEYRDVPDFPRYRVGDDGTVWSNSSGIWKQKKMRLHSTGYLQVDLYKSNQKHSWRVHRLVLEVFVGPCPPGMETRHLDGTRFNNKLANLAWGTKAENRADGHKHNVYKKGEQHTQAKMTWTQVQSIRKRYQNGRSTMRELARDYGCSLTNIHAIITGKTWMHG